MKPEIKEEFQKLIPPLTPDEYSQLEKSCISEGIREAIIIWNGIIIDGHNRYNIATANDLKYRTVEKEFENEKAVKEWMILNQFGRRNLSNYQRSLLALELEGLFKEKAKEKQREAGGAVRQKSDKPPIDTKKELAKVAGVSHDTIAKVKKIENKATQEVKDKLEKGDVSINEAYNQIRKEEKMQERQALIEKQIEDIENNELPELKGKYEIISVDPPWPYGRKYDPSTSRVANPYPEMSIEQIKNIELPFTDDSILFLWTTHQFLPDAFEILKEWGFAYKACLVWNKEKIGMGAWFRMQCEFCLFAVKGKPFWSNTTERDIINEARRQHSRKPDAFFEMVDKICVGRKLEYFSREARKGWEVFGNDIDKF